MMNLRESIKKSLRIQEENDLVKSDNKLSKRGFLKGLLGTAASPGTVARAVVPAVAQAAVTQVAKAAVAPKPAPAFQSHGKIHPNWSALGDSHKLAHLANHHFGLDGSQGEFNAPLTHKDVGPDSDVYDPSSPHHTWKSDYGRGITLDQSTVHPVESGHVMYEDPFYAEHMGHSGPVKFDHVDHEGNHTSHKMHVDLEDAPEEDPSGWDDAGFKYDWLANKMERHVRRVTGKK